MTPAQQIALCGQPGAICWLWRHSYGPETDLAMSLLHKRGHWGIIILPGAELLCLVGEPDTNLQWAAFRCELLVTGMVVIFAEPQETGILL